MRAFAASLAAPSNFISMRLLSFLTDVERALRLEANAGEDAIWESSRIVNFKTGLGRLTLTLRDQDCGLPAGTVLLQYFALANGSFCLKATLNWEGSNAGTLLSIYDTPTLNWKLEASRVATAWLAGPPATATEPASALEEERIAAVG